MENDYLELNRRAWNWKTGQHYASKFYDVDGFLAGKSSLHDIEQRLLGDVRDRSLLHLQCHFGQDSISLARFGAKVLGIDFSDTAIEKAKLLNVQLGLNAKFLCCDVYDLPNRLDRKFDIVFTSYGVLGWLPDMDRWATVVSRFLKPDGHFVLVEFHPAVWMFNEDFSKIEYPYDSTEPIFDEDGTYTDTQDNSKHKTLSWNHGLASVSNALIQNGIRIEEIREYDYSPYDIFHGATESEPGRFKLFDGKLPLLYSIVGKYLPKKSR